jgi:YtkA-like
MRGYFPEGRRLATRPFCGALLASACLATLSVTACRRSADSGNAITVNHQITPQPVRAGESTVDIELADAGSKPVAHATMMVEADMTHPGMSPIFAPAAETTPGTYHARLNLTMGGDWVLLLHIQLPNGKKIERQVDVRGVQD